MTRWRQRAYWFSWIAATASTGVVAGFMLGHALLLGRYLDWLLASGRARVLTETYPVFAGSAGGGSLAAFQAIAGLQVASGLGFALSSFVTGRSTVPAIVVGIASVLWPTAHYASGFAALEAQVLHTTAGVSRESATAFQAWNVPIHLFHAATLTVALGALLSVPLSTHPARS